MRYSSSQTRSGCRRALVVLVSALIVSAAPAAA